MAAVINQANESIGKIEKVGDKLKLIKQIEDIVSSKLRDQDNARNAIYAELQNRIRELERRTERHNNDGSPIRKAVYITVIIVVFTTLSLNFREPYRHEEQDKRYFPSCKAIKKNHASAPNGLYDIKDDKGSVYRTYCDMTTGGGGWTLVASVHENFLAGKCTTGDRWSSEHGNNPAHPHGDGNWENLNTFGAAESATSDDYKNPGYFNMVAKDVMIWHVPNNTPLDGYESGAFMMYHTTSGFLHNYGGNLQKLFKDHYPLRDRVYQITTGNGPSPAIVWDRGSNDVLAANIAPSARDETIAGYIQFRAINHEGGAFAICPGVKIKPGYGHVEHECIGGTSNHGESHKHCGDFASLDFEGYGTGRGWSASRLMVESVVMIFYR